MLTCTQGLVSDVLHDFLKRSCGHMQIDYEVGDGEVWKMTRSTLKDWTHNLETIQSWCPYANEEELFDQVLFSSPSQYSLILLEI